MAAVIGVSPCINADLLVSPWFFRMAGSNQGFQIVSAVSSVTSVSSSS